jgi:methionyl-tRNA formyltransferase
MECGDLRILFAANPEIASKTLVALHENFNVVGVLTNEDKPVGRSKRLEMPPVKKQALELGIPVLQFERLLTEARNKTKELKPNFLISFACGHYFGPKYLDLFPLGAINIHPSLLPLYRGCAPLQFALLNGETKTGITIQRITAIIDSGNILNQMEFPLKGSETYLTISEKIASLAPEMVVETLNKLCAKEIEETVQNHPEATFTTMLTKEDGLIDWNKDAKTIHCQIRALYPWPKASTTYDGKQLIMASVSEPLEEVGLEKVSPNVIAGTVLHLDKKKGLAIATGDGLLYVNRLQLAQKKEMDSLSFYNGNPNIIGSILGG